MSSDTSLLPRQRSAEARLDPAAVNVPARVTEPAAKRISILPAIDLYTGTIGFALPGGWQSYFHPEPWRLESALRQAIRPAQWNPYLEVLTITVASVGQRSGEPFHFSLTPLTRPGPAG